MANVLLAESVGEAAGYAAEVIYTKLRHASDFVLGVATGGTPQLLYRDLAVLAERHGLRRGGVEVFALDEYVGLPSDAPQSYATVVRQEVTEPLQLDPRRVHVPDGSAHDAAAEAMRYDTAMQNAGGVRLQILGIGSNGHIGFNEPGSPFDSRTRVIDLDESTRRANARFFDRFDDVPTQAITQGIATILGAEELVLLAFGEAKAAAVAAMLEQPPTTATPASALQGHPNVTILLDEASAARCAGREDYRRAWRARPLPAV